MYPVSVRDRPQAGPPPGLQVAPAGLLVVSGPPLAGKGSLAARIHEALPESVKLELEDNLTSASPYASAAEGSVASVAPEAALLARVPDQLAALQGRSPAVIVVARFGSPALRQEAANLASRLRLRFLLVEVLSAQERSIRRLSRMFLSAEETADRLTHYREALAAYLPLSDAERAGLPALTLKAVLADVEQAALLALAAWRER